MAAFDVPRWEQRKWRSFDARQVHDLARNLHMATMYADPTSKPHPDDHPLADLLLGGLRDKLAQLELPMPDERRLTAQLDDIVESGRPLDVVAQADRRRTEPVAPHDARAASVPALLRTPGIAG